MAITYSEAETVADQSANDRVQVVRERVRVVLTEIYQETRQRVLKRKYYDHIWKVLAQVRYILACYIGTLRWQRRRFRL